jgi:hypothetical protein
MKIYIAGSFYRKLEFRNYAAKLREHGHEVTSSWLDSVNGDDGDLSDDQKAVAAAYNLVDLKNSELVLSFTEPEFGGNHRGGRHVELGYGLGREIYNVCVGTAEEHIFHHSPTVFFCPDFSAALNVIRGIEVNQELKGK